MATITPRVTVTFVDFEGETAVTSYWVRTTDDKTWSEINEDIIEFNTVLSALSNCALGGYTVSFEEFATRTPPAKAGAFASVEDKALMLFNATNGLSIRLAVPGPKDTIFLSDAETVDRADSLVDALVDLWVGSATNGGYISTNEDTPVQDYNSGYRKRAKSRAERPGRYSAIG